MIHRRTGSRVQARPLAPLFPSKRGLERAGAEEEQWVLPRVKFEIGGITLTSDMTVGADGGIEGEGGHGPDVLVSMGDIQALVAMGADFSPVRTMWNGRTGEYSS